MVEGLISPMHCVLQGPANNHARVVTMYFLSGHQDLITSPILQNNMRRPAVVVQFPYTLDNLCSHAGFVNIKQTGQAVKKTFLSRVNNSPAPIAFTNIPVILHPPGFAGSDNFALANSTIVPS
jgi:hypothetical protein